MTLSDPVSIWLTCGIILMALELIIPGGVVVFIGLSSVLTGGLWYLGIVNTWSTALVVFFILTMILVLAFRGVTQRLVGGDATIANTDEDLDIYGQVAKVVETIGPGQKSGRIEFQGTQWDALGNGEEIVSGQQVKIICHENIAIVVEPCAPATEVKI